MHKHVRRNSPEAVRELRMINHKVKNQGKINDLRRRIGKVQIAYEGGSQFDRHITQAHKDFQNMHDEIARGTDATFGKHINAFGHECKNEALCGSASGKIMTKMIMNGLSHKDIKVEGGVYTGPGAEYSPAVEKTKEGNPSVFHEYVRLSDGTIIDPSVGQFMNQKNEIRQNQRLRVIPPNGPLQKHYTPKYNFSFSDFAKGKRNYLDLDFKKQVDRARRDKLRRRIGKIQIAVRYESSFGPDLDALEAFKNKQKYQSFSGKGKQRILKFESTGKELKLHGHIIARHHPKGIEVSNAGHDTGLTYESIKGLGINARANVNGRLTLHNKDIDVNSGEFVLVPHHEILDKQIKYTNQSKRKTQKRSVTDQTFFNKGVMKEFADKQGVQGLPLSVTDIQPEDQKIINKITGVTNPIGKKILGTVAHHTLPVEKFPGLIRNISGGVPLSKARHDEVHNPKKYQSIAQLKQRLALIRSPDKYKVSPELRHTRADSNGPLINKVPFGDEDRTTPQQFRDRKTREMIYGGVFSDKIRPDKPTQKDRRRIIKAKLALIEPLVLKKKKPKVIRKIEVKNAMTDNTRFLSADAISDRAEKFIKDNPNWSRYNGTYDPINNEILDAKIPQHAFRLQRMYGVGNGKIGFNSITDTRKAPVTDMNLIRSQLREMEQAGGIPAIGMFNGSLEATKILSPITDQEALDDLLEHQRSTAILDANTELRILNNPKFRES